MFRLVLCAVFAALICGPATASTYYVATWGSDTASGSLYAPWRTISRSINSLAAGDTLYVRKGTYVERVRKGAVPQGTATASIDVKAFPGERPVLMGLLWLTNASYWIFDGLNVTWHRPTCRSNEHMVKFHGGVGWQFINAEVWGARSYAAFLVSSSATGPANNWRIANCQIHDTYSTNGANEDQLIYCNTGLGGTGGVIEGNRLWNAVNGAGVKIGGADSISGGSERVVVRYNTIYNTSQSVLVSWLSANNRIERNILAQTRTGNYNIRGYQLSGDGNTAAANVCYLSRGVLRNDAGYMGIADGGENVFPLNPLFDYIGLNGFRPLEPAAEAYGVFALPAGS
jgi:hypothetical protein